jgi:hypothetical protein
VTSIPRFPLLIITIIFLIAGNSAISSAQTVEEFATTDSLKAGDLFNYSFTLKKDQGYDRIIYPDSASFNDVLELRKRQRFSVADFKDSLSYRLQFWGVANDTIPSLPVKLVSNGDTTTVYTQPVPLLFKTVLQGEDAEFRPLKPIFQFFAAWWPWLLAFLLLLIAAAIFYWFYSKRGEESEPAPEFKSSPFLDPLKELENNLRQLKDVSLDSEEQFKQFYINLGDAIRLYFEQLYHIPALESTSREIIYELDRRAIDQRLVEQTRIVLREADMVKFAKFTPTREQAKGTYKKAEEFLSIAQTLHGSRIQQMRQQHLARIQENRKEFNRQNPQEVQA